MKIPARGHLVIPIAISVGIHLLYPIAQILSISPFGTAWFLVWYPMFIPCCLLMVPGLAAWLAWGRLQSPAKAVSYFLLTVLILIGLFPVSWWAGGAVRHYGFAKLSDRSHAMLIAIDTYKSKEGSLPSDLAALVPKYLPRIPTTGMRAYPDYRYVVCESGTEFYITVSTPSGLLNWDEFMYCSDGDYPDYGKTWEPIGEWKYYHE